MICQTRVLFLFHPVEHLDVNFQYSSYVKAITQQITLYNFFVLFQSDHYSSVGDAFQALGFRQCVNDQRKFVYVCRVGKIGVSFLITLYL